MTKGTFLRANGKLLLTGEYLVLDGAKALSVPVVYGQTLEWLPKADGLISWRASDTNGVWFEAKYSTDSFTILNASEDKTASFIQKLLITASHLSVGFPYQNGMDIHTHLNFDRFLGLGSSSTIIALIASLFNSDKYKLHSSVSEGSGYDIVSADVNHPIFYQKIDKSTAVYSNANFNPSFSKSLFFVYLGKKQDTNKEISRYRLIKKDNLEYPLKTISEISSKIVEVQELVTFASLMEKHEQVIASVLDTTTIKEKLFSDFNGFIKSLGAWGGDFILTGSAEGEGYIKEYFRRKEIEVIYSYDDLVLNHKAYNDHESIIRF